MLMLPIPLSFFFFNDTATTEIYTLSLHDALPICTPGSKWQALTWFTMPSATPSAASQEAVDRKSTRLNSSHVRISYAVFCLKKKKIILCVCFLLLMVAVLVIASLHATRVLFVLRM